ncbi:MAG: hypothetical protein ACM3QU_02320 [Verrucomicrobiota bacterium]
MAWKLVLAAALAALLAGCGGSAHVRRGPPPTKAAFATAADRICRTARTHRGRIAGLSKLAPRVPLDELDLYRHWLSAERLAVGAGDVLAGRKKAGKVDPLVELAIARGKIAGYAQRLGANVCAAPPGVTIPS